MIKVFTKEDNLYIIRSKKLEINDYNHSSTWLNKHLLKALDTDDI